MGVSLLIGFKNKRLIQNSGESKLVSYLLLTFWKFFVHPSAAWAES